MRRGAGSPADESSAVQRIKVPLILMVMAIFADDAIEMAGMKQFWWWDELLAASSRCR